MTDTIKPVDPDSLPYKNIEAIHMANDMIENGFDPEVFDALVRSYGKQDFFKEYFSFCRAFYIEESGVLEHYSKAVNAFMAEC